MQTHYKKKRAPDASSRTSKGRLLQLAAGTTFLLAGLLAGEQAAWAQSTDSCMNDNFNAAGKRGNLVCTAKEVYIAENPDGSKIIDATIVPEEEPNSFGGCDFPGDTATVDIVADIHFNADRFDVGLYSALDGGDALRGTCAVDPMPLSPAPATDLDGPPDICGDVVTGGGGADLADFSFQRLDLLCEDTDGDNFLDFSTCFSWRTSGNNDLCVTETDIFPGTKSKCFCERVNIPVPIPAQEPTIDKSADPTSVPEPGGDVTFTVTLTNPSPFASLTVNTLTDTIYGDLTVLTGEQGFKDQIDTTCEVPQTISLSGTYSCTFTAFVSGTAGSETNVATGAGEDENGNPFSVSDDAIVTITDVSPVIAVMKTANPTSVEEPGGNVTFTVDVTNNSGAADPVTITMLGDNIYGDLDGVCLDAGNLSLVGQTIQPGGTLTCTFVREISGQALSSHTDVVSVQGEDDEGTSTNTPTDDATVDITDLPAMINLDKSASPTSVNEPGGNVEFTLHVQNTSDVDVLTVTSLEDERPTDSGNVTNLDGVCLDAADMSLVGQTIQPGGSLFCTFTVFVSGNGNDSEQDKATVKALDDDVVPNEVTDTDTATVTVTPVDPAASLVKIVKSAVVTYEVEICNDSTADSDPLTLLTLNDEIGGNSQDLTLISQSCAGLVGDPIAKDACVTCTFNVTINSSTAGEAEVMDTVTATLEDDEETAVTPDPSDTATVIFTD